MTWLYLMKNKHKVFGIFQSFHNIIKTQFFAKLQIFWFDNGGEYCNNEFQEYFQAYGLYHETTCSQEPKQNEVAKWKKKTYPRNSSSPFNYRLCTLTLLDKCICYYYLLAKLNVISSFELGNSTISPCSSCTITLYLNDSAINIWMCCLCSPSWKPTNKTW